MSTKAIVEMERVRRNLLNATKNKNSSLEELRQKFIEYEFACENYGEALEQLFATTERQHIEGI